MPDPLSALLELSEADKAARGVQHTAREIWQQPVSWKTTYQQYLGRSREMEAFLTKAGLGAGSLTTPIVFLVGAGTSDYIGRALAGLLRRQWRCQVSAIPSTTLLLEMDGFILPRREYLWISFSRSGDSSEGVAVLERAARHFPQVRHLVVTCNHSGAMAQFCAQHEGNSLALILDDAVNDRGLAMTSSFSNMVVAGHCLANFGRPEAYGDTLDSMAAMGQQFLSTAANAASAIAKQGLSKACFVGSGALSAVAKESALKLLELTAGKVLTMCESTLGLRHGPLAALDENTLYVQFLSSDPRRRGYETDLLAEIRKKGLGRPRVVVAPSHLGNVDGAADHLLLLDTPATFSDDYRPPVDIMLGQLLGLFSSLREGLKPDCPSPKGAINRVVSNVTIYP